MTGTTATAVAIGLLTLLGPVASWAPGIGEAIASPPVHFLNSPLTVTDVSPDSAYGNKADPSNDPSGRVNSLAIDPSNDSVLYAATDWSGVWKSTDAAHSWQQASIGLRTGISAGDQSEQSIAVDALNSKRLLYATQDDDGTPAKRFGGLWISLNAAASWQHVDLPSCPSPNISTVIFASGYPFVATKCGIFTNSDPNLAAANWTALPNLPFNPQGAHLQGLGLGSRTIFAVASGSTAVYRSLNLGMPSTRQPTGWDNIDLGPNNYPSRLAIAPLKGEFQPSTVLVVRSVTGSGGPGKCPNQEVTVVDFGTTKKQDLAFIDYSGCQKLGAGPASVFAAQRKSAPSGETRPGVAYDVYASDGCAFFAYSTTSTKWSKLQGGQSGCNSGIHADSWSMAFPSTYDTTICKAYAATDGGVFAVDKIDPLAAFQGCLTGWVQAQSGLHAMFVGTIAGVSFSGRGPVLYLPTGDEDTWVTADGFHGGSLWNPLGDGMGDAAQSFIDPALPTRVVSTRGGGDHCGMVLTVSTGSDPPSGGPAQWICDGPEWSWGTQPPNMGAFSQVMTLPSETPPKEGQYFSIQRPTNCGSTPCNDLIVRSVQQDNPHPQYHPYPLFWSLLGPYGSSFFGPGQVGGIATSGGVTSPTIFVLTGIKDPTNNDIDVKYSSPGVLRAGQVWKGTLSDNKIQGWTPAFGGLSGLKKGQGLFANPYDPNELYVTDLGDIPPSIKSTSNGGQSWSPQTALTDIATNHGEFRVDCQPTNPRAAFSGTCSLSGMAFDRQNPNIRVAALYPGGLAFSRDRGQHWIGLDVTYNAPIGYQFGLKPGLVPIRNLIEYPQSVFYDSQRDPKNPSIYMGLIGNSIKRVDGPFLTLQSATVVCVSCSSHAGFGTTPPKHVSAKFTSLGSTIPLTRGADGLFRGKVLFDSSKFSKLTVQFLVDGGPTPEVTHTLSAAEIRSGVTACSPPKLGVSLTPAAPISSVDHPRAAFKANIDARSNCELPPAVQLISIAAQKGSQREEIGGAPIGTDVRELELPAPSGSENSRNYVVTYKETDLFGDSTLTTIPVEVSSNQK